MSEEGSSRPASDEGIPDSGSVRGVAENTAPVTTGSKVVTFRQNPIGDYDLDRAAQDLKARIANRRHERDMEKARRSFSEAAKDSEHRRLQESKDNELRRRVFYALGLLLILALLVGTLIATVADNADTRRWAQGVVVALLSGVIGAAAGWFSHKSGS